LPINKEDQPVSHIANEEDKKWIKIIEDWRQSGMSIAEIWSLLSFISSFTNLSLLS
jgi:hypothetical protein